MENKFLLSPRKHADGGPRALTRSRSSRPLAIALALGAALALGRPTPVSAREFLLRVGDLHVPAGTVVHGAAIAVGGTAYVDGTVEGDAIALGGNVDIRGHVAGSARAHGGSVILHATAVVDGEVIASGGTVRRDPGASVGGRRSESAPPSATPPAPAPGPRGGEGVVPALLWWWLAALAGGLLVLKSLFWLMYLFVLAGFVGAAWVIAVLFPHAVARFGAVLERDPVVAFGAGLLGWPMFFAVAVLLAISVVGLTLVLLVPAALVAAVMFGTTAVAFVVGQRIRHAGTVQEVVVGAVILAIVFSIPGLGGVAGLVVATWGLGAVLLAFLEWRRSQPAPPAPPPSPQP